jgi:hypothetical protein
MAREQAGIDIIATARTKTGDQAHLVTVKEVGDLVGLGTGEW